MSIAEYKIFTEQLLKEAGKVALKYFRKSPETKNKKDGSLVTIADTEIEKLIRAKISKKYKSHKIIGEEFGISKNKSDICWVIDPIDGTSSFAAGRPIWGIMIGLVIDNIPVLGAVYQPYTGEMWIGVKEGKNYETYYNGKIINKNKKPSASKILATTSPDLLDTKGKKLFSELAKKADNVIYGGDCYNYCLLASGYISTIYEQNLKPHDYIPLLPILWGVGAKVTDENGKEIKDLSINQGLVVNVIL